MRHSSRVALVWALLPFSAAAQVPAGGEFLVSTYRAYDQDDPAVAMDAAGNFVVAWTNSDAYGTGYEVFARHFDAAGVPLGPAFVVPTGGAGSHTSFPRWPPTGAAGSS